MNIIQQITSDAVQQQTLILADGTSLILTIRFVPMQYGWFIDSLVYQNFTLNGLRIVNSPNFLYQYRNILPFGIACYSTNNREPSQQEDFASGNSVLYLLTQDDVNQYVEYLTNG